MMRNSLVALLAFGSRASQGFLTTPTPRRRFYHSSSSSLAMSKRVLVPIAEDSEEIETTCITDTCECSTVAERNDGRVSVYSSSTRRF